MAPLALLNIPAFFIVPLLLLFAKWDKEPSADSNGKHPEIFRGDLPKWASWFSTPDERLPGGTYEPTVYGVLQREGRFICAWYWLGWRNVLHGLNAAMAKPINMPWSPEVGSYTNGEFWWKRTNILGGKFQFKRGWRTYLVAKPELHFIAVPCWTITRA